MNKSTNTGLYVVIGAIVVIGIALYVLMGGNNTTIITPLATTPVASSTTRPPVVTTTTTTTVTTTPNATSTPFTLTEAQKKALMSYGISTTSIPTVISVTQEACFVKALDEARVKEIRGGAIPSTAELLKVKGCF